MARHAQRPKPFGFLLNVVVAPFGHPVGVDPGRLHLVEHYSTDPARWAADGWGRQITESMWQTWILPPLASFCPAGSFSTSTLFGPSQRSSWTVLAILE